MLVVYNLGLMCYFLNVHFNQRYPLYGQKVLGHLHITPTEAGDLHGHANRGSVEEMTRQPVGLISPIPMFSLCISSLNKIRYILANY